ALVARSMRHVSSDKTLLALVQDYAMLQIVAPIDGAFTLKHVGNCLDRLVIVCLSDRAGRHWQHVHADLLRSDRLGPCTRTVGEALFAHIGLARLDNCNAIVCRCGHHLPPYFLRPRARPMGWYSEEERQRTASLWQGQNYSQGWQGPRNDTAYTCKRSDQVNPTSVYELRCKCSGQKVAHRLRLGRRRPPQSGA